ncbi:MULTISPECIES: hypothetical protein [unclassified Frankia]|nr:MULTISPECIES: hypothetical protein [unclassified Frankia]
MSGAEQGVLLAVILIVGFAISQFIQRRRKEVRIRGGPPELHSVL